MYLCKYYSFYTAVAGDTHIWVLQFVNPIVKALYSRSTTQIEALSILYQYSLMFYTLFI